MLILQNVIDRKCKETAEAFFNYHGALGRIASLIGLFKRIGIDQRLLYKLYVEDKDLIIPSKRYWLAVEFAFYDALNQEQRNRLAKDISIQYVLYKSICRMMLPCLIEYDSLESRQGQIKRRRAAVDSFIDSKKLISRPQSFCRKGNKEFFSLVGEISNVLRLKVENKLKIERFINMGLRGMMEFCESLEYLLPIYNIVLDDDNAAADRICTNAINKEEDEDEQKFNAESEQSPLCKFITRDIDEALRFVDSELDKCTNKQCKLIAHIIIALSGKGYLPSLEGKIKSICEAFRADYPEKVGSIKGIEDYIRAYRKPDNPNNEKKFDNVLLDELIDKLK